MNASQRWIMALLANPDAGVEEKSKARILENCGRSCLSKTLKEKGRRLYAKAGNRDAFREGLGSLWPAARREDQALCVVYPQCHC